MPVVGIRFPAQARCSRLWPDAPIVERAAISVVVGGDPRL